MVPRIGHSPASFTPSTSRLAAGFAGPSFCLLPSAFCLGLKVALPLCLGVVLLIGPAGCGLSRAHISAAVESRRSQAVETGGIESTVILIGDAGLAQSSVEPVLLAVTEEAARQADRTLVVFLGDNVYPAGVPEPEDSDYEEASRRLASQVDAVLASGARGLFIPGNHDHGADGAPSLRRAAEIVAQRGRGRVTVQPIPGCPGPDVLDFGRSVRLVNLDSEAWMTKGWPGPSACRCESHRIESLASSLERAIRAAGDRHVIVAGHHPLETHGTHGGEFTWLQHVFPFREIASWAWFPLPVLGSLHPVVRSMGVSHQDNAHAANRAYRQQVVKALTRTAPLLYASGHEHNLQLLEASTARYLLVSGAGTLDRPASVFAGDDTLFASPEAGFFRLDFLTDGSVHLTAIEVDASGEVRRTLAFRMFP